jgi:segregation and condensation protein A
MLDPVQILVDLASRGEIDPWDIDIIQVTDKFLSELERVKKLDLRVSGRTLFYASVLLRMKAEALEEEPEEIREPPPIFLPGEHPLFPRLRRISRRPITLDELIQGLKEAERIIQRRKIKRERKENGRMDLRYEEKIEEKIKKVSSVLEEKFSTCDKISFSELVVAMSNPTIKKSMIVSTYLSVLFLATIHRTVFLEQDEIWSELYIRKRDGKKKDS